MLIYGNYSITAEKTITGGIPKSWCDYSPEVTCGLHPHHISGVTIDSGFIFCWPTSLSLVLSHCSRFQVPTNQIKM